METIRDGFDGATTDFKEGLARGTVHEIGHQFNVARVPREHRPAADNVMFGKSLKDVPANQFLFHPDDVSFLRFDHRSPGSRAAAV